MHIDAVMKAPSSFEHIPPETVGNSRRILMSEVSGRGTIIQLINEVDPTIDKHSEAATRVMDRIKELEYEGYQFEGAESSIFEMDFFSFAAAFSILAKSGCVT